MNVNRYTLPRKCNLRDSLGVNGYSTDSPSGLHELPVALFSLVRVVGGIV